MAKIRNGVVWPLVVFLPLYIYYIIPNALDQPNLGRTLDYRPGSAFLPVQGWSQILKSFIPF